MEQKWLVCYVAKEGKILKDMYVVKEEDYKANKDKFHATSVFTKRGEATREARRLEKRFAELNYIGIWSN